MNAKIQVFSRHTLFSRISQHKKRLPHFSHEACYHNLLHTIDRTRADLSFLFDASNGPLHQHFLSKEKSVIQIQAGSEADSFLYLLEYIETLRLAPDTILYFVEDDYLHRPGWTQILEEAFQIPAVDYATLYDHRDKYFLYPKLTSRIFTSFSCHWRTIPSTTHTFATRVRTLLEDLKYHRRYSRDRQISADHEKFCKLTNKGRLLISSMPGWSTHAETDYASPCIAWEQYFDASVYRT
ncbi:MAG: hypothetical protein HY861_00535 [Chlamydiia bacterium]|nr:hypothetical protein [Chlamydiia bacterium]